MRLRLVPIVGAGLIALCPAASTSTGAQAPQGIDKLSHILVIYLENRSFDSLFGEFPGADGIANAGSAAVQIDRDGNPYNELPPVQGPFRSKQNPPEIAQIPVLENLPNKPFAIDGIRPGVTVWTNTNDLQHLFYANQAQIHGGRNDWFVAYSNPAAGGLTMGHYSKAAMQETTLWRLASAYTLLDNFFQGAFGGSFLNHQWLICACAPLWWPDPPDASRSELDAKGYVLQGKERNLTALGQGDYAVNTTLSIFLNDGRQGGNLLPPQGAPTIGDRLSAKGVNWAWYAGGWELATKAYRSEAEEAEFDRLEFQYHHQPFAYYERFSPLRQSGRDERAKHLKDAALLETDIRTGKLPPVAFYKPAGLLNQHPGYANLKASDEEVDRIFRLMEDSPMKHSYALIITYDENGGFFDHVRPPRGPGAGKRADFFGPGSRIPAILVSPFARRNHVDHTQYETTSIMKFIAERHRLDPMPSARFEAVDSLAKAFDFSR